MKVILTMTAAMAAFSFSALALPLPPVVLADDHIGQIKIAAPGETLEGPTAIILENDNKIIDPPRRPVHLGIVTPNEGPTTPTTPPIGPGEWFPRMIINASINGPSTFEDSIVRQVNAEAATTTESNFLDSDAFDPASPQAEQILNVMDQIYESETGLSAYPTGATVDRGDIDPALLGQGTAFEGLLHQTSGCVRQSCSVWAVVSKASQRITIYVNGSPISLPDNRTSTGTRGNGTPNFDKRPDGRIYQRYTSRKFPGGDYNGLGNTPWQLGTPRQPCFARLHSRSSVNRSVFQFFSASVWSFEHLDYSSLN
jgi:lipoprotein-anchoring transpeptidase ErfK/SrfK